MASFQSLVLTIAIVILLLALVYIGFQLARHKKAIVYKQPIAGACPDYWTDTVGGGQSCVNVHSLGTCNLPGTNLYTSQVGKDSIGNNVTAYNDMDADDCQAICTSTTGCAGLVYNTNTRQCQLKSSAVTSAAVQTNADTTLYIKSANPTLNAKNFTVGPFSGADGDCQKAQWAQTCGVTWDGLTCNRTASTST